MQSVSRKLLAVTILFVFCFCNTTCKKIWKYPISMYGTWTSNHDECAYMLLKIKKNGSGNYGPYEGCGQTYTLYKVEEY